MEEDYLTDRPFHTPDRFILARNDQHIVLGCGRIKEELPAYCTAYTVERMSLFVRTEDKMLIPIRLPNCPRARIAGTLYSLDAAGIERLDNGLQNRVQFDRKLVRVIVPDGDSHKQYEHPVWMYIAKPEFWGDDILNVPRYSSTPYDRDNFHLAKTHLENDSLIHNHYRYDPRRIEDAGKYEVVRQATDAVLKHVAALNKQEVSRSGWFGKTNRLQFLRNKFRKKLNECAV